MASQLVTNLLLLLVISLATKNGTIPVVGGEAKTWCVARSDMSELALQVVLDYACGSIGDCDPIQPSGLCYLPNTVQSHASYAVNSFYQRKANAPGSCDFNGTATTTNTDPSYGFCVYPSSPSTAGGTGSTTPATPVAPRIFGVGPGPDNSKTACTELFSVTTILFLSLPLLFFHAR